MRLKVSHLLALVALVALSVGLMAGPASAKMSAKQKAHVRAQLRKQVKKNPKVVTRKAFLKKASLVNFQLPVTIRLRGVPSAAGTPFKQNGNYGTGCSIGTGAGCGANPNSANIDLGPSLGQRQVALGGSLSGNIIFKDSYDGGALGNVDLQLKPDTNGTGKDHTLKTTSIPLLWNPQVSTGRYDANDLYSKDNTEPNPSQSLSGCSDWKTGGNSALNAPFDYNIASPLSGVYPPALQWLSFGRKILAPTGTPGYPYFSKTSDYASQTNQGYLAIQPGVDGIDQVQAGDYPGSENVVGPTPNPFPAGGPGGFTPTIQDTVLRTNALSLNIADVSTEINQSTDGDHPSGSQNIVIGKSGGEANLFGNIPGKSYGIDITANFVTKISSLIRVVDQDSYHRGLISDANNGPGFTGNHWPAGVFNCSQVWTGYVTNYIPGVRLQGNLKIAPGLTSDGHLRIAKATVSSPASQPARFAVAACLSPEANYKASNTNPAYNSDSGGVANGGGPSVYGATQTSGLFVPDPNNGSATTIGPYNIGLPATVQPLQPTVPRTAPQHTCNQEHTGLLHYAGLDGAPVDYLTQAIPGDGYTISASTTSGARVSVAADLSVTNVSVDVLIGDV